MQHSFRAHLEFASAVLSSMSKKYVSKLKGIQKKATKMVIELRGLDNGESLKESGLKNLEIRRKRGDLIQIYKITKGFKKVELNAPMR